jgi:hypothetical protein
MSGLIPGMDGAGSQPGGGGGVAGAGAKASRDDAGFIPAGQICGACENFTKQTGDCSKVEGTFQAHDTCKVYFEASNGAGEMPGENEGLESTPGMGGGGGGQSTPPTSSPRSSIGTMNA